MGGGEAFRGAFFRGEKNCILKFDRIGIQVIEEIVGWFVSIEKFFFTRWYILEIESLIRKKRFCNFNILSIEFCKVIYSSIRKKK